MDYEYGQPVLLNYTEDDLGLEDLGMSGIVLHGPFYEFERRGVLNSTFYFFDYFKNLEWCSIEMKNLNGDTIRSYNTRPEWIKPDPSYEKIGDSWYQKY